MMSKTSRACLTLHQAEWLRHGQRGANSQVQCLAKNVPGEKTQCFLLIKPWIDYLHSTGLDMVT